MDVSEFLTADRAAAIGWMGKKLNKPICYRTFAGASVLNLSGFLTVGRYYLWQRIDEKMIELNKLADFPPAEAEQICRNSLHSAAARQSSRQGRRETGPQGPCFATTPQVWRGICVQIDATEHGSNVAGTSVARGQSEEVDVKGISYFTVFSCMAVALLFGPMRPAEAALLSVDDATYGAGSLTQDSLTGLEWLDVTGTAGLSMDDVLGGANGYLSAGFRHADQAEVTTLYLNLGFPAVGDSFVTVQFGVPHDAAGELAVTLLGQTTTDTGTNPIISAFYLDGTDIEIGRMLTAGIDASGGGQLFQGAGVGVNFPWQFSSNSSLSGVGHYLVRDFEVAAVSEPGSLALLALGLFALGWIGRRQTLARAY